MKAGQVLAALPGLSQADLKAIKAAIENLLHPDNVADTELFHAVMDILGIKSLGYKQFAKTKAFQVWSKNQPVFDQFLDVVTSGSRIRRHHSQRFLMALLVADLKAKGVEVTMPNISAHLVSIEEVFESQFPGYVANNLTHLIFKNV